MNASTGKRASASVKTGARASKSVSVGAKAKAKASTSTSVAVNAQQKAGASSQTSGGGQTTTAQNTTAQNTAEPATEPSTETPATAEPPRTEPATTEPAQAIAAFCRGESLDLRLEPNVGPVGTGVNFIATHPIEVPRESIRVRFTADNQDRTPTALDQLRFSLEVPLLAESGPVTVTVDDCGSWQGEFRVTAEDSGLLEQTAAAEGLVGNVYALEKGTKRLPDFDTLEAIATIALPQLAVPARNFTQGFPGITGTEEELVEWFGIVFRGQIRVEEAGEIAFRLNSDDGSKLFIDDTLIVDNDGQHGPRAKDGTVRLSSGLHDLRVEYFQGPRKRIALELFWKPVGADTWVHVPAAALFR